MRNFIGYVSDFLAPVPGKSALDSLNSKLHNFGFKYRCPLCRSRLSHLQPLGKDIPVLTDMHVVGGGKRRARCPCCKSSDRERLLYLFLLHQTQLFSNSIKLLHVAPEKRLTKVISKLSHLDYLTIDLDSTHSRVMEQVDITKIPYPKSSFDAILCNHVLEHIPDDRTAMLELYRVLRPGGWAILQVPISMNIDTTIEDFSITNPEDRERMYGQHNHVRLYGRDYVQRLQSVGFTVSEFDWQSHLDQFGNSLNLYGLNPDETIYFVRKQD